MTKEVKKFDAEVGKVLQLMIHSLYTNKEVAIRELISNASDACDKLKFLSQTDNSLIKDDPELKISIEINQEEKQIIITDNGIGMNKQDLDENLGTIARSGTQNFINQLTGDSKKDNMLIGQFGVGFYSAFMISDLITVKTKKAGESKAYTWFSNGNGEYTISDTDEDLPRGTQIILNIKPEDESFLDHFKLKHIVKSYSDHIATPIFFVTNEGETKLNLASAIWRRPKSEVLDSEYKDFYKSVSYSMDDPWMTIHNKNEGTIEYTNLLFIPSTKTFDLFHPDRKCRVKLYIKRVFIADEKIDVIPNYLRFIRGVVDSEDLPLNISRETLQHNSVLEKIKNSITKRVLSDLQKKKDEDRDSYQKFWDNFGAVLKEGLCEAISDHEKLLDVCLFRSALHNKFITLNEYIENAGENCKNIYFLSGDNPEKLINSPQIEGFLTKGIDVLLFTDTVDDFWVNVNNQYKGAELKSVTRSDIDLDEEGNQKSDQNQKHDKNDQSGTKDDQDSSQEHQELINFFKDTLGSAVKDVKLSKKLTSSPACLSAAAGAMDIRMERFLIEQKQLQSASAKVLEINPSHPIIKNIEDSIGKVDNQDHIKDLVHLMFDQACILEGEPLIDSSNFAKRINKLIEGLII